MVISLNERASVFLGSGDTDDDDPVNPVHERWTAILSCYPKLSRHWIYEDFTSTYQDAYASGEYRKLMVACDLAHLQVRFFSMLMIVGGGMRHILQWHLSSAVMWRDKLGDRLEHASPEPSPEELCDLEQRLSEGEEIDGAELVETGDDDEVLLMTSPDLTKRLTERTRHRWLH